MLNRERLLLKLLACVAIAVLAAPFILSTLNISQTKPASEAPTTEGAALLGAGHSGWTTTEVISTESTSSSMSPSLAVDSDGNAYIAWQDLTDYDGSGTDWDIFYKRYVRGSGWIRTEVVSTESGGDSLSPSLAVDPSGNVHIAWQDRTDYRGSGTDWGIFYKRYVPGNGWTRTEVVSTESTGDSLSPSLAVDPSGNVHIAWQDRTNYGGSGTDWDIFYKRYVWGSGWTATEVVSTESTSSSMHPSLAVDSSGNVHVAWDDATDYGDSDADLDIFYKRYVPGSGWTATELVSTEGTGDSMHPSLAVDSSGNVHIAWQDYSDYGDSETDWNIFYKRYVPESGWTTTELVSTESTSSSMPSLAVDSSENAHIAWQDYASYGDSETDWDIFYKRYVPGSGWTTTEVVSNESSSSSMPSLAVDSGGNVHVTWQDHTNPRGSGIDVSISYKHTKLAPPSEPILLKDLVDFPGVAHLKDLYQASERSLAHTEMMSTVEGLEETKTELESRGFVFEVTSSNVSKVEGEINHIGFRGAVLSWWSADMDTAGRMAFIVAAMMDGGHSMVFGAVTNLIPPEILFAANQSVIVDALPYTSVEWFFYDDLNNRIAKWGYWWYYSNSNPNWFWNLYKTWRNYVNEHYGWYSYLPWWWWFWHYIYDKQWHNWAAEPPQ